MIDDLTTSDLPVEMRIIGHRVSFKLDVTGRVKATCRAFPRMLVRDDDLARAIRGVRKEISQLMAARMAQ